MKSYSMFVSLLLLGACGRDEGAHAQPAGSPAPVEVGVVTVEAKPLTLTRELPGRTSAFRVAEVRARVNGIVLKRLFTEGSDVKAGPDAVPDRSGAVSGRARERAGAARARRGDDRLRERRSQVRYDKLIETNAVSRQEYDDAIARHEERARRSSPRRARR